MNHFRFSYFRPRMIFSNVFIFLVGILSPFIILNGCTRSSAKIGEYFYTDSLFTDSFGCNGHSYIRFRVPHTTNFQIVHNPDCYCRYHRTFIVVKRGK